MAQQAEGASAREKIRSRAASVQRVRPDSGLHELQAAEGCSLPCTSRTHGDQWSSEQAIHHVIVAGVNCRESRRIVELRQELIVMILPCARNSHSAGIAVHNHKFGGWIGRA